MLQLFKLTTAAHSIIMEIMVRKDNTGASFISIFVFDINFFTNSLSDEMQSKFCLLLPTLF